MAAVLTSAREEAMSAPAQWEPARLNENPYGLVSLLDIVKLFEPDKILHNCRFLIDTAEHKETNEQHLTTCLRDLLAACLHADLKVSCVQIRRNLSVFARPHERQAAISMSRQLSTLIEDECSTNMFFMVDVTRRKFFDDGTDGWTEAITRWPDVMQDVIESGKCFVLRRHAAAVFHALQITESGVIELGRFIGVRDPKPGWTATMNELRRILAPTTTRTAFQQQHFGFLEQINATCHAIQTAWRNKISHIDGRLKLMTADFDSEMAEEIIIAVRSFMRRLATDLPETVQ